MSLLVARLGSVLHSVTRAEAPVPGRPYRQIGVKLWGAGAYEREPVDGGATRYSQLFRAESGDVIVNKIWARNGSVAVVSNELAGCYGSNEFPMFEVDRRRLDVQWVHWLTKTPAFWEQCDDKSRGTSGQNRIRPERFLEIEIPLPTIDEQRRILARIEELAARMSQASTLRRRADEEGAALLPAACEKVFQELAAKHGTLPIVDLCTSLTDGDHNTPPFTDEGVRFIFVGNVSSGVLHFDGSKRVAAEYFSGLSPLRVPKRGDILYTAVGATLGIPALVDTDEPFCFQRHVAILKPRSDRVDGRFLWYMLQAGTIFKQAWASTTGSAQPTVPLRAIRALAVPLPPIDEQQRKVETLDRVSNEVEVLCRFQANATAELDALMPAILDRAFRGEL